MTHTRLWLAAGIIAIVIVLGFMLSVPHTTRDVVQKKVAAPLPAAPLVAIRDSYKKGTHTLLGTIQAPNACTTATTTATLEGDASTTQSIRLALTTTADPGVCLELPTPLKFSTTIAAPSGLPIIVTVNDVVASTTSL